MLSSKFQFISAAVVLVASFVDPTFTQTNYWQQTSGPEGGQVVALSLDSSGYIYAGVYAGGVYRSIDNGSNWVNISQSIPNRLLTALSVSRTGNVIAATQDIWAGIDFSSAVYASNNQGNTWLSLLQNISYVSSIHVNKRGDIFVSNDSVGYLRSSNNGVSWSGGGTLGRRVNCLVSKSDSLIFVGTDSGAYRSTVSGRVWAPAGLSLTAIRAITVDSTGNVLAGSTDGGIFLTSNDGANWSRSNVGSSQNDVRSITVRSHNNVIAGTSEGVFRSSDGGRNWVFAQNSPRHVASVLTNSASFEMAGTDSGVLKTSIGGTLWEPSNSGLKASRIFSLRRLDDGSILAGTGGIVITGWVYVSGGGWRLSMSAPWGTAGATAYRTSNFGDQWSATNLSTIGGCWSLAKGVTDKVYAANDSGVFRYGLSSGLWTNISQGINASLFRSIARFPNGILLAFAWGEAYRSTNEGISWNPLVGSPQVLHDALAIHPNGNLFAGSNSSVWRSTDEGTTWTRAPVTPLSRTCSSISFNSLGYIFAAFAGGGLYRSTDLGISWSRLTNGITDTIVNAVANNREDRIFIGTSKGVFTSSNNGDSWMQINSGLGVPYVLCLEFDSRDYLYAGTYGGGVFRSTGRTTNVADDQSEKPVSFSLAQNYPNPFNPTTTIEFALRKSVRATLKVFDLLGREVATLVDEELSAGSYKCEWNAEGNASGIYLYRLQAGEYVETKKLLLMR